ncbi:MAG: hypothetical protein IPN19_07565 [Elusimicrobia bacterium]|nr:hypothetical protein [Elusimicrobiota bacterium]
MTKDMTLSELAVFAESLGRELAQAMLTSRLEEDPRTHPQEARCRHCTGRWRFQNTAQRRVIQTAVGPIEYRRAYGVCDRCGHTGAPLDEALGIPPFGPSVETRKKICHAAVVGRSFEAGREILQVHSNVDLSAKHVRWIAGTEGGRVRKERDQERTSYAPPRPRRRRRDCWDRGGRRRVQTRSADPRERWKEDKIGIVYDATATPQPHVPRGEYEGAKAKTKTYVATLADWEAMGWLLRVEAERRGYARAENRLFVADGARSIRELKNLHFPEATFILDWAHAASISPTAPKPPSERERRMPSAGLRTTRSCSGRENPTGSSPIFVVYPTGWDHRPKPIRGISAPSPPPKRHLLFSQQPNRDGLSPLPGERMAHWIRGGRRRCHNRLAMKGREVLEWISAHRNPASSSNGGRRNARLVCSLSLRRRPMGSPLARTRSAALMITSRSSYVLLMFFIAL